MPIQRSRWLTLALLTILPAAGSTAEGEEPELAALMATMQVYLHKLDLSVQHNNAELIAFYVHELEEVVETIENDVETYDGFPVGELTGTMMVAPIEALENAARNQGNTDAAMQTLVDTCNACHAATDHAFIKMTRATSNPFNQSFENDYPTKAPTD